MIIDDNIRDRNFAIVMIIVVILVMACLVVFGVFLGRTLPVKNEVDANKDTDIENKSKVVASQDVIDSWLNFEYIGCHKDNDTAQFLYMHSETHLLYVEFVKLSTFSTSERTGFIPLVDVDGNHLKYEDIF